MKSFVLLSVLSACLGFLCACEAPTDQEVFAALFSTQDFARVHDPAPVTLIFWVNGDSDHFVTEGGVDSSKVVRGDAIEVKRLRAAAEECGACNVLIVHEQRGGARWYTPNAPWATYLWVYSKGQLLREQEVPFINGGNPDFLASYLKFAEKILPETEMHFVYRGHSFQKNYDPANPDGVAPFVFGFPDEPYGLAQFSEGLFRARLSRPLESVTLAACSMASIESARAISSFAKYLIASEVDVLETVNTSFDYDWLKNLGNGISVPALMRDHWMDRFDAIPDISQAILEYPATLLDLTRLSDFFSGWDGFLSELKKENPDFAEKSGKSILSAAHVVKRLSQRYVDSLKAKGNSDDSIRKMIQFVQSPSIDADQIDVVAFLDGVLALPGARASLLQRAKGLRAVLESGVSVSRNPGFSGSNGLSFEFSKSDLK